MPASLTYDTGIYYFAYGSNLHPGRLGARLVAPRLIGCCALSGHALRFNKRGRDTSGKCTIIATSESDLVHGAVYALTTEDKERLDNIEGLGAGYDNQILHLPGLGPLHTYVAAPGAIDNALRPYAWYLGLVLAGARHLRFPAAYVQTIAATATSKDPDHARAAEHAALLAMLTAAPLGERLPNAGSSPYAWAHVGGSTPAP